MNRERQRKLDARARRQASLNGLNTEQAIAKIEKPKVEVQPTKVKSNVEPKVKTKIKTAEPKRIDDKQKANRKDVLKKKHNSKVKGK